MKHILSAIAFITLSMQLNAQSIENKVIASGGKSTTVGNVQLEYTVGETFVKTFTQANNSITQGFHQPTLTVTRVANNTESVDSIATEEISPARSGEISKEELSLNVFPNPTADYLNLQQNVSVPEQLQVEVTNMEGQLVKKIRMEQASLQIDFTQLKAGTYLVIIQNEQSNVKNTYRVVKTN